MKTLVTDRLILRAWKETDEGDLYEYARSKTVGPMAGWRPHETLEDSGKIITMFMEEDETWAVCDKKSGKVIGSVGIHRDMKRSIDKSKVRMLGYALSEEYWGRGIVPEACREVMRFAFDELHLEIMSVYHFPFNEQSKRVIEKLGFKYEGTLRMATAIFDGTIYDDVCYSITRDEFD